jgi:hypothetical protein
MGQQPPVVARRPAEAAGVAGAVAVLVAYLAGVDDAAVIAAIGVVAGAIPAAVTALVGLLRSRHG